MLQKYSDITRRSPPTLRGHIRSVALDILSLRSGPFTRPRVHFLYLHHVLEDEADTFRSLLTELQRDHQFVDYSRGVRLVQDSSIDRPYLTISVDDGIANCLKIAAILDEFGIKGCFFVCPVMADPQTSEFKQEFSEKRLSLPATDFLTWKDYETLKSRDHEIGNHTMSHFTLSNIESSRLEDEIGGAKRMLESRLGTIDHFAWPRGTFAHMTREATDIVFRTGHRSCASAIRGAHVANEAEPEKLCIRRDHIIAGWPLRHSLYFISRSAQKASALDNEYPW